MINSRNLKNIAREYIFDFKSLLNLLIIFNILLLMIYEIFLHPYLLKSISSKADLMDREYYTVIFNNIHYAFIIAIVSIFLILVFYKHIKKLLEFPSTKILAYCIILNILIQLFLLFMIRTVPISDSKHYIDSANLFYETGKYVNSDGNFTAFWPIGLPAYLVILKTISSDFILIAKLINILLSNGLVIICYLIFKDHLSTRTINIFLIIFTFFPNNLFSSTIILTDYPFLFFLWLGLLIMRKIKSKSSIVLSTLLGISFALASYLRPIGIPLAIMFFVILFFKNYPTGIKSSIVMFTAFILILLPWSIRNFNLFHSFVPVSSSGGYNFLMGNHINSSGGINFDFEYNLLNPNELEESSRAYNRAISDIMTNPIKSILRLPLKFIHTYYRGDSSITWGLKKNEHEISGIIKSLIFYSTNLVFYLIIWLNICVIFLHRNKIIFKNYTEMIVLSVYIFLIIMIFVGSERYHIPLLPIHIFLAAKYFEKRRVQ